MATGLVAFRFQDGEWLPYATGCVESPKKKYHRLVAENDARRIEIMVTGIDKFIAKCPGDLVIELPNGAARGSRAQRCMGISTALMVTLGALRGRRMKYVTPKETREAACPGQKTVSKDQVVEAVQSKWAWTVDLSNATQREAVADAVATFWAGKIKGFYRL